MRLIDADKMIGDGENSFPYNLDFCDTGDIDRWVLSQPTIDAEPVIHAHWVPVRGQWDGVKNYKCSLCGQLGGGKYANLLPRCPHCGARMDEEA